MIFINPLVLSLLVLLPITLVYFWWREGLREKLLRRLGDISVLLASVPRANSGRRKWKLVLWGIASISLIVALARPVWGEDVNIIETQGASVMVVLDVSRSMNAQDVTPSRLERAKLAIQDLFNGLEGNDVGLILFAGHAFVRFPLTTDTLSATSFLKTANSDAISRQGTNIDAALRLAIDSFNDERSTQKYIILITDGENFEGEPLQAADEAVSQGIMIHTLGYGTPEGAPIPLSDETGNDLGYQTDQSGNPVLSALDETMLKIIAERTGGSYRRVTSGGAEIARLIETINGSQATKLESRAESRGIERFSLFVGIALLALSIEILLPELTRKTA